MEKEKEGLSSHDIQVLLFDANITLVSIARTLYTSRMMVWKTINRKSKGGGVVTYAIRRKIAELLDVSFKQMWGVEDPYGWMGEFMLPKYKKRKAPKYSEEEKFQQYLMASRRAAKILAKQRKGKDG